MEANTMNELDYKLIGHEMQFVEITLQPGQSVIAEAGSMMYKDAVVQINTIVGDGSSQDNGIWGKIMGAGKRLMSGAGIFITTFTNAGSLSAKVAFAAPYPGNIIPVRLPDLNGTLICQKDCFLCAARGVSIDIFFQRKILTGLFGGDGFIMQKLVGNETVFMHAGGTILQRRLQAGETVHVDTGCVVAFEPSIEFDIEQAGNVKTALFGGEGLFFATLRGPGNIWLQSLPFAKLAGRIWAAAPQQQSLVASEGNFIGKATLGGAILGGLGSLLNDNNDNNN
jgi:uncharacterized protein (TIGR00266 family)